MLRVAVVTARTMRSPLAALLLPDVLVLPDGDPGETFKARLCREASTVVSSCEGCGCIVGTGAPFYCYDIGGGMAAACVPCAMRASEARP